MITSSQARRGLSLVLMHNTRALPEGNARHWPAREGCPVRRFSHNADYKPWFSCFVRRTEHFPLPLQRSDLCRMAERRT
jgi:hypothetical protein